jgi:hypothetical protein
MKLWHVVNEGVEKVIDIGSVTVLKNSESEWFKLTRNIDDFFNNKKSEIFIYEDTELLHPKDWECLLIPYDASLQLDKLNAKSPLKNLMDEICDELAMSPVYYELLDVWESLREEMSLVKQKIEKYDLGVKLKDFEVEGIKNFLSFSPLVEIMTPIQFKKLLLKLFAEKGIEKKKLIIIELPELYAEAAELAELFLEVNKLSLKGINFIINTQESIKGNSNSIINGEVINEAKIESIKRKIVTEVPFYCEDDLYDEAKMFFLQAVDNQGFKGRKIELPTGYDEKIRVVIFVMIKTLDIGMNIDLSGVPPNIRAYIKSF